MFEAFETGPDLRGASRYALSTGASAALLACVGVAVVLAATQVKQVVEEARRDVVFRPLPKAEPLPPPPPPPATKPKPRAPPKEAAAVAPANIVAPREVPLEKPPEAEVETVAAAPVAVGGTGTLVPGATAGALDGVAGGTGTGRAPPINLPENATPPRELASNAAPDYPAAARSRGQEGLVILKLVVEADGSVSNVRVMRGEEPFASAAVQAVQRWRYEPARVDGHPAAVFRIVKVPFRLKS